jgi:hypothetical protein
MKEFARKLSRLVTNCGSLFSSGDLGNSRETHDNQLGSKFNTLHHS